MVRALTPYTSYTLPILPILPVHVSAIVYVVRAWRLLTRTWALMPVPTPVPAHLAPYTSYTSYTLPLLHLVPILPISYLSPCVRYPPTQVDASDPSYLLTFLPLTFVHLLPLTSYTPLSVTQVDASDPENISTSKSELHDLLAKPALEGIPALVLGNKNDLPNAAGVDDLIERLGLKSLANREVRSLAFA